MEVHARTPVIAKRLWNVLRITFFMIRKGLISKRKLMMDMNLMMKRGKLLRKSLSNLISHHHHSKRVTRGSVGLQEYEFSCSNSPNPVFFHVSKRKHHNYFPCINPPEVIEEEDDDDDQQHLEQEPNAVVLVPKTPEYSFNFRFDASELAPGEERSPLLSPFSVRVSNYSSEDETDGLNRQVDDEAEEFIKRFYEQLKAQSRIQLLQYQDSGDAVLGHAC
ncbi:uncharacterized protein LOC110426906 [Herrania umbratica]|uniref:Uncharacterized protein LOC110426906 n=1 Tax=Herrania umbratica TaxID=108875 RepID=A0A6J1BEG8_9ROSI|nr:uncharacterized protein LOC110426906 [Herrania umbratica]